MIKDTGETGLTDNKILLALYGVNLLLSLVTQWFIAKYYWKWRHDKYTEKNIKRLPKAHWIFFVYLIVEFVL